MASRVSRGIALPFLDRGIRRGWVVSSTPQPHFTPGKDPIPIVQEAGWAPGLVWTGGKSRPTGNRSPDRPARSQSLYRLSYLAHSLEGCVTVFDKAVFILWILLQYTKMILKWNLKEQAAKTWNELIWLRTGTNGGCLWTGWWTFRFH
jgi:hypothetical protein